MPETLEEVLKETPADGFRQEAPHQNVGREVLLLLFLQILGSLLWGIKEHLKMQTISHLIPQGLDWAFCLNLSKKPKGLEPSTNAGSLVTLGSTHHAQQLRISNRAPGWHLKTGVFFDWGLDLALNALVILVQVNEPHLGLLPQSSHPVSLYTVWRGPSVSQTPISNQPNLTLFSAYDPLLLANAMRV